MVKAIPPFLYDSGRDLLQKIGLLNAAVPSFRNN